MKTLAILATTAVAFRPPDALGVRVLDTESHNCDDPDYCDICGELKDLWIYVPDYPAVKGELEKAYARFGVEEWAAESGRVGGCPNDADITVRGPEHKLIEFEEWLRTPEVIEGLMIRGEDVQ